MIIVTGGAGFIGSNIVKALNDKSITDILVVDNLKDGTKFVNLVDLDIADYMDKEDSGARNPVPVRFFRSHLRRTHLRLY